MIDRQLSLTVVNNHDRSILADLLLAQHRRLSQIDARLHAVHSPEEIEMMLRQHEEPFRAINNTQGHIRGYVQPAIWHIHEKSILQAFLTSSNGVARRLTLPAPNEHDALAVTNMLLHTLNDYWQHHNTSGELIQWPSRDTWLEPVLKNHGFLLDSVCAFRSTPPTSTPATTSFIIRTARPADQESLVALFREELLAHKPYTPFVRLTPTVLQAFRTKLELLWRGTSLQEGAPLILTAEQNNEIIALAECSLLHVKSDYEPGYTPPGCYGCIDNICVKSAMRGQGAGHQIVQAVYTAFTAIHQKLDGYVLWYNPDNPLARLFWARAGFEPLWTTYQRLHQ